MNQPSSITAFLSALDRAKSADIPGLFKGLVRPEAMFQPFASWSASSYTRNCIARTEKYELVLLCWQKGAHTSIHGHAGQRCWVYQVSGTVAELRYEKLENDELTVCNRMVLDPGRLTYMDDQMGYHALKNVTEGRAMTLHLYVSPIDACEVYDNDQGRFFPKDLSYDTIASLQPKEIPVIAGTF